MLTGLARISALVVFMVGSMAIAAPDSANAEGLTCGRAYVEGASKDPEGITRVIHSCTGTGTVQYTVDCLIGQDAIFTQVYRGYGFSIRKAVTCASGSYGPVSWKII